MRQSEVKQLTGKTGWQANGQLITGGANVVHFQADFDDPDYYTIQLDATIQTPFADPVNTPPIITRALITWCVEGNFIQRLINVGQGVVISGTGQGFSCKVFDWSQGPPFNPVPYTVSAQVTRGTRPSAQKPPTLTSLDGRSPVANNGAPTQLDVRGQPSTVNLDAAGGLAPINLWNVPQNAGVNQFRVSAASEFASTVIQGSDLIISQGTNGGLGNSGVADASALNDWIPLDPSSGSVSVQNQSAKAMTVNLIWGVEG